LMARKIATFDHLTSIRRRTKGHSHGPQCKL
jgi:hypothetical protein